MCCTEAKKPKTWHNVEKRHTRGDTSALVSSAVPAVDVESILQGECERSVRDVGVGSPDGDSEGGKYTGDCDCVAKTVHPHHLRISVVSQNAKYPMFTFMSFVIFVYFAALINVHCLLSF